MARLGADVDQLDALASYFDNAATTLDGHAGTIDGQIRAIWWRGSIADMFTSAWVSADRKRIATTATGLRETAKRVRENAMQQRMASGDFSSWGALLGAQTADLIRSVSDFLSGVDSRSPEEIRAWWDSLSEEERREVIANNPGFGNQENVPLRIRYEANHMSVEAQLATLNARLETLEVELAHASGTRADLIRSMLEEGRRVESTMWRLLYVHDRDGNVVVGEDGEWVRQQILYADLSNGEIAVVIGSLEGANEVLITTPGTSTDIHKYASNFAPEARLLEQDDRAVISTFVWDPPSNLAGNLFIDNYTDSIVEGGMDNIVRTAADHSNTIISVSHSAGTDAMIYYAEHSETAHLIDGYVMLGAPNPEAAPAAIGDEPVAFGYHERDEIRYTDAVQPDEFLDRRDNYFDALELSEEHSNVTVDMKPSGLPEGGFGTHHQNSAYYENFGDMIDGMVDDIQSLGESDLPSMGNYA